MVSSLLRGGPPRPHRSLGGARSGLVAATALAIGVTMAAASGAERPRRVVSTNLCTDQLAMAIAEPEQIVALSRLARDPALSEMAAAAGAFPAIDGRAEEIVPLAPDLVLAGVHTALSTVAILRRLGYRVEEFAPPRSFADIRAEVSRMGELLGRPQRAAALVAEFDARLDGLRRPVAGDAPVAVVYHVGNRAEGRGTLTDEILTTAGWRNLAADLGIADSGALPLELLVMRAPDVVVIGTAEAEWSTPVQPNRDHPVLRALFGGHSRLAVLPDRWSICGSPAVVETVRQMVDERRRLVADGRVLR